MLFMARSHYHHQGVAVNRLFVSSPRDYFLSCPLWGTLPLLIYVEGAGYMWSPSRTRTSLSFVKEIFVIPFLLNRPTIV